MDLTSFPLPLSDGRLLEVRSPARMMRFRWLSIMGRRGSGPSTRRLPPRRRPRTRYVSYSRPGYGGSSRRPDRAVADCAADTAAILAHLGAERCCTVGASGEAPCPGLCRPAGRPSAGLRHRGGVGLRCWGLDFLEGMGGENHDEFGAALAGPAELQAYLEQEAQAFAGVTGEQVAAALGDLVSAVDVAALTGDFAAYVAASFRQALANGIWGWFDDDLAFTRIWGSTWSASACPWSSGRAGRTGWSRSPRPVAGGPPADRPGQAAPGGPLVDRGRQVRRGHRRAGRQRSRDRSLKRLAALWQSSRRNDLGQDRTSRTADPTRPAAMLSGVSARLTRPWSPTAASSRRPPDVLSSDACDGERPRAGGQPGPLTSVASDADQLAVATGVDASFPSFSAVSVSGAGV